MNLQEDNLLASFEIYVNYGNSSSATIMAVMDRLRTMEGGRKEVVACAFGPGISLEMMMLRRRRNGAKGHTEWNGYTESNGQAGKNGVAEVNGLPTEDVD